MSNLLNFDKPKNVIQWLIFLAAIGVALSSPYGTRAFLRELGKYLAQESNKDFRSFKSAQLSQAIYYLKKRKLIKAQTINNKTVLVLTEKGKKRKLEYDLGNIKIPEQENWDGKWRLLMFDIPESAKIAREALREKLKKLGFAKFQKSVWLHPFPCENEIDFISECFSIGQYLNLLTVQIEDDQPLRRRFDL
jgi:phenylacetic acid degradation operon negative regulatory protein